MLVLLLFFVLISLIILFFKIRFLHWKHKGVYTPKPTILFGNAKDVIFQRKAIGVSIQNAYKKIKQKGKRFGGYYFLIRPIFMPVELDLIKSIMVNDFSCFTDRIGYANEEYDPLSSHLLVMKGYRWKQLRSKLTPTFTSGKMKMMFETLLLCSNNLKIALDQMIDNNHPIDMKEITARFTTDIIASCAFGLECNSLNNPNSEFRHYGKKIFDTSLKETQLSLLSFILPELLSMFRIRSIRKDVTEFFLNVVKQTVKHREENNIVRKDFMHLLIQIKNNVKVDETEVGDLSTKNWTENESSLTINELAAQCFLFFTGGFETSSTTTTFCMYELALNIKLQDKLRNEVVTVLGKYNGQITYDAIMEMTYMDQCINESLRKYPVIPFVTRECTKTYKVPNSNVVLKKGSYVFIPISGVQMDPEYFPNPDNYEPERFSEENKAKRHSSAWMPFGDGPRACIGIRFGVLQTKLALTILLRYYKFTLNSRTEVPLTMDPGGLFFSPINGVWLDAKRI